MLTILNLTSLPLSQRLFEAGPKTTCLSSFSSRVPKSLISFSSFRSTPLNFLRPLPTSHLQPLPAQAELLAPY